MLGVLLFFLSESKPLEAAKSSFKKFKY